MLINLLDMHINEPLRVMIDFESHVSDDMTVLYNVVIMKTANSEISANARVLTFRKIHSQE